MPFVLTGSSRRETMRLMAEGFEPTEQVREWLDELSPEDRHAALDWFHGHYATMNSLADSLDRVVDILTPCQRGNTERTADHLTGFALWAESCRAHGRGDFTTADELAATSHDYMERAGEITFTIRDPKEDAGGK